VAVGLARFNRIGLSPYKNNAKQQVFHFSSNNGEDSKRAEQAGALTVERSMSFHPLCERSHQLKNIDDDY
jgi:hypothetical protein